MGFPLAEGGAGHLTGDFVVSDVVAGVVEVYCVAHWWGESGFQEL